MFSGLNDWEHGLAGGEGRLLRYLREQLPRQAEANAADIERWRGRGVLWLLDGIDEIRDRAERLAFREELVSLARSRSQDHFVVSTRPQGYEGGLGGE